MARTAPASTKERQSQASAEPANSRVNEVSFESRPDSGSQESVQDAVARLAYSYWLERQGSNQGSAEEDWLRAERELRARENSRG